jgi:hypothetical protein
VEQPVFAASGVLKAFDLELPKMRASQGPRLSLRGEAVEKRAMEMETMPYSWGTHLYSIGCLGSQHNILTFPYSDFSEYACGLADGPP